MGEAQKDDCTVLVKWSMFFWTALTVSLDSVRPVSRCVSFMAASMECLRASVGGSVRRLAITGPTTTAAWPLIAVATADLPLRSRDINPEVLL